MMIGEQDLPRCICANFIPPQRPTAPSNCQVYIPIETLSDDDKQILTVAQSDLQTFGFNQGRADLSRFIKKTQIFSSELQMKIYPVLKPKQYFAIYQSWM